MASEATHWKEGLKDGLYYGKALTYNHIVHDNISSLPSDEDKAMIHNDVSMLFRAIQACSSWSPSKGVATRSVTFISFELH